MPVLFYHIYFGKKDVLVQKLHLNLQKSTWGGEYEMRPSTIRAGTAFEKIKEIEERERQW